MGIGMSARILVAGTGLALGAAGALGQPYFSFVHTGFSPSGVSNDGTSAVGAFYDSNIDQYRAARYVRGVGFTLLDGTFYEGGMSASDDLGAVAMSSDNLSNWNNINCFNGTNPPFAPPCAVRKLTFRWSQGTGWVNTGGFDNVEFPLGSGNFFDATRCDFTVNSPNDTRGNGQFTGGGAWRDVQPPLGGICGRFRAFRYNAATGVHALLPSIDDTFDGSNNILTSGTTRADAVNDDGTVIVGYSTPTSARRLCVWTANGGPDVNGVASFTHTVLDPAGYNNGLVNGPGTLVMDGGSGLRIWTRTGTHTWAQTSTITNFPPAPSSLVNYVLFSVLPTAVSDDGGTIVGVATYAPNALHTPSERRAFGFIIRPGVNSGNPTFMNDYLASIDNPSNPTLEPGWTISSVSGMNGDGTVLMVGITDDRNTCPVGLPVSHFVAGSGLVYLDGVACEPPRVLLGPADWAADNYISFGVSLNMFAAGTGPLTYEWEFEPANNPGTWISLLPLESCVGFANTNWDYEGVAKAQLRINMANLGGSRAGRYRCIVSNDCGSVTSDPATVTFGGACVFPSGGGCVIDYRTDCVNGGGTFLGAGIPCPPACVADVDDGTGTGNPDGGVTIDDLIFYLAVFDAGDVRADVDDGSGNGFPDGGVTIDDLIYFLFRFDLGC